MSENKARVYSDSEIAERLKSLPGWEHKDGRLRRKYKTGGWQHSVILSNTLAYLADAAWHHPDIRVSYLEVAVTLITFDANGITDKDFALAAKFDEVALWRPSADGPLEGWERGHKGKKDWTK